MSNTNSTASRPASNWIVVYAIASSVFGFLLLGILIIGLFVRSSRVTPAAVSSPVQLTHPGLVEASQELAGVKPSVSMPVAQTLGQRLAAQKIAGLESHLTKLRGSLLQVETAKADHARRVKAYALEHKAAIAAMGAAVGGVAAATDKKSKLTKGQRQASGLIGGVGALYALANGKECMQVADEMTKAAAMQADYDSQIKSLKNQIASYQSQIAKERGAIR